mmetsp:Transcript_15892/g.39301  ORF Transcript_15892/g.39301 Transcript_15892/m.39301 type:complete len:83 (+) Transcript_15892:125-373(+)
MLVASRGAARSRASGLTDRGIEAKTGGLRHRPLHSQQWVEEEAQEHYHLQAPAQLYLYLQVLPRLPIACYRYRTTTGRTTTS